MNQTVLEELVVKLVGEGSSFQKMMTTAADHSQQAAKTIEIAAKKIENIKSSIEGFARSAVTLLGTFGLASSLTGAFNAFETKQAGIIRMNAALEANGRDVKATSQEYLAFSRELEKVSTSSVGNTMNLLRMAESYGLTGKNAENATRNSVYLASALDGTTESAGQYFRVVQALEQGDLRRAMQMSRMIPQLRGVHNETEYLTKVNALLASGQKASVELSNTAGNQLERMQRLFKGLTVEIGGLVAESILPFLKAGIQLIEQFNQLDTSIKKNIAIVAGLTLGFLALPYLLSTVGFILQALGINFAFSTAMQAVNIVSWLLWTGIVLAAQATMAVFSFFFGLFTAALNVNTISVAAGVVWWAISNVAMLAWTAVVLSAKVAVWLFVAAKTAYNAMVYYGVVGTLAMIAVLPAYGLWLLITKGAVWLLNTALTAKNVLLAGIPIVIGAVIVALTAMTGGVFLAVSAVLALVATLVLLTGAFFVLGVPLLAAYITMTQLWELFSNLPEVWGPLNSIGSIFKEWYGILKDVLRAAQVDMPIAWELMKAGFGLAVAQIKGIWPPLWTFIQEGFGIVWDLVKTLAWSNLKLAPYALIGGIVWVIDKALQMFKFLWEWIKEGFSGATDPANWKVPSVDAIKGKIGAISAEIALAPGKEMEVQKEALANAQNRLKEALGKFKLEDSPEVITARNEVNALRTALAVKEAAKAAEDAKRQGANVGANYNSGLKSEMKKTEGVLRFSAEAIAHISDYIEGLRKINAPAGGGAAGGAPGGAVAPPLGVAPAAPLPKADDPGVKEQSKTNMLIARTNAILEALANKQGINVPKPAEIGA